MFISTLSYKVNCTYIVSIMYRSIKRDIWMYFWYNGQKINFTETAHWQYTIYKICLFCSNSTFQTTSYQDSICRLLSVKFIHTCHKLSSQNGVNKGFILQQRNMVSVLWFHGQYFYSNFLINTTTQNYIVTKNFHITLCAVLLLYMWMSCAFREKEMWTTWNRLTAVKDSTQGTVMLSK